MTEFDFREHRLKQLLEDGRERKMAAEMEKIIVKYVAKSFCCETCTRLEEIKDKVREDGKTRHCFCACGSAQVWVVKEKARKP